MNFYYHHYFLIHSAGFSSFFGAFAGAFFAFVFGLIAYWITKRRERFVQHKNTLVKLNRVLMKHLHEFGVLETVIRDTSASLKKNHTTSNRLNTLAIPDEIEMELGSLDLTNKVFSYRMSIDRLNFNIMSTNHTLMRLEDLYINGQPVIPVNFTFLASKLDYLLAKDLPKLNEWTKKLLVLQRIHQNRLSGKSPFIEGLLHSQWEQNISKEQAKEEYSKLENEVSELAKSSPDDIF
jgi:hypothetical protein